MKLKDNEFISFLLVILILFPLLKHSWKVKGGKAGAEDCRDPTGRKLS